MVLKPPVFDAGLGEHWVALTVDQQALFRKVESRVCDCMQETD